ncbi:putative membrane protein YedE/YeeE [Salinibacter ruber]|jgi:hypothetical protein|nr:putative membrane protein YedE/YeeE [Salinibacter ruber]MCS4097461.1 putative membrane protein YedE/YeeE [Salinibacter ruber]MCS4154149.1 putative membrane protein YedE/YeeE [Salinibacter ruber]
MSNPNSLADFGRALLGGVIGAAFGALMGISFGAGTTPEDQLTARRTIQLVLFVPAGLIFGIWMGVNWESA